jgi:hypothetical protein
MSKSGFSLSNAKQQPNPRRKCKGRKPVIEIERTLLTSLAAQLANVTFSVKTRKALLRTRFFPLVFHQASKHLDTPKGQELYQRFKCFTRAFMESEKSEKGGFCPRLR